MVTVAKGPIRLSFCGALRAVLAPRYGDARTLAAKMRVVRSAGHTARGHVTAQARARLVPVAVVSSAGPATPRSPLRPSDGEVHASDLDAVFVGVYATPTPPTRTDQTACVAAPRWPRRLRALPFVRRTRPPLALAARYFPLVVVHECLLVKPPSVVVVVVVVALRCKVPFDGHER